MVDISSSDSSLVWIWAIEYLASFPLIDPSILHDLIDAAPELPDDLGKTMREMVALRCLEELFGPTNGLANDVSPAPESSKVAFDLSESCEDVLQCVLQGTSISDSKRAGIDLLKWDIHPFIMHKRASMPRCYLEQLKDSILDGTNQLFAFLSKLINCEHDGSTVDDHHALTEGIDGGGTNAPIVEQKGNSTSQHCGYENEVMRDGSPSKHMVPDVNYGDHSVFSWRTDGDGTGAPIAEPERNFISQQCENEDGVIRDDSPSENLLPSKRDRSDVASENLASKDHNNQSWMDDDDDQQLYAKRFKHDGSCSNLSMMHISVPPCGKDLMEDSSERLVGGTEACSLETEVLVGRLEEGRSLDNDNDHGHCVATKICRTITDSEADDKFQCNQQDTAVNFNQMPQDTSGNGPSQYSLVNEADDAEPGTSNLSSFRTQQISSGGEVKDRTEQGNQLNPQISASLNGPRKKINAVDAGGMEQHHSEEDKSSSEEDTSSDNDEYNHEKVDVAMEKNQFLSSQCALSHDSLATADWTELNLCVKCSEGGQLLVCSAAGCPLVVHERCLGSPAKFDDKGNFHCPFCAYSLAISQYLGAKRMASSARKELAKFIHMGLENHAKEHTEKQLSQEHGNSRQEGNENLQKMLENRNSGEVELNQSNDGGRISEMNGHQFQKGISDKQQAESSASHIDDNLVVREGEPKVNGRANLTSTGGKEGEEMVQECPPAQVLTGQDNVHADCKCSGDKLLRQNKGIASANQTEGGFQNSVDTSKKHIGAIDADEEDTSDDENDNFVISNYSIRFRTERHYTYPSTPQLRRKKLPWTAQEEEILKEGVQKFSSVHDRGIPWKKILEYGSSIFLSGRTPVDLKDKWRNLCKGSPKYK